MHVTALHTRLARDIKQLHEVIDVLLPIHLPKQYENRSVNILSFLKRLNAMTELYGIHNRIKHDKDVHKGRLCFSAWWYPKSILPVANSNANIHIRWHTNPCGHRISWSKSEWNRRRFFFWQYVMHELLHRYQNELRYKYCGRKSEALKFAPMASDSEQREMQEYLGDYDEIETYAFMTALEIYYWWPKYNVTEACDLALQYSGTAITPTYMFFMVSFDKTSPVVKIFKRKIRAWYDVMRKNPDFYDRLQLPQLIQG